MDMNFKKSAETTSKSTMVSEGNASIESSKSTQKPRTRIIRVIEPSATRWSIAPIK